MPWHSAHYPALSVGILKAIADEYPNQLESDVLYANLKWIEYLRGKTANRIDVADYQFVGEDLIFKGAGEWVFSSALHQVDEWKPQEYQKVSELSDDNFELVHEAHLLAPEFINDLARDIIAQNYDLVGFTSTFMQNAACLSLAKELKRLSPEIDIIMGGGNCDGSQGPAIHKNFPFVDYVVSGEGEKAFRRFIDYKIGDCGVQEVPNLVWRDTDGKSHFNKVHMLTQMSEVPSPVYDEYFDQVLASPLADRIEFNLVVEGARGCWWGQKHHCTFCGLNGTGMTYRLKDGQTFVDEVTELIHKHQTLDIVTADNIIGMDYFRTVLPIFKEQDYDLRIHYEVKANLRFDQLQLLKDSGVCHLQPGIESLTSKILKQMDKGTTGVQNVRVLRDMSELGLTATWNILVGFPDEQFQDYQEIIEQIPALVHIQPPSSVGRIALQRFSPYFNKPELGFTKKKPAGFYGVTFDLPDEALEDMVYLFEGETLGITPEQIAEFSIYTNAWKAGFEAGSLLTYEPTDLGVIVRDNRTGWARTSYIIDDPVQQMILLETRTPKSRKAIYAMAGKLEKGAATDVVDAALKILRDKGLVFSEEGFFVSLPTAQSANQIRLYGSDDLSAGEASTVAA
jgi:ribosomal peptide maturation radical SAM protein 1